MGRSSKSGEFAHDSLQDTETIGKYLEALAQGFRNGRLQFSSGKKDIEMEPAGLLELAVRARRKDGGTRISVEVQWKEKEPKKTRQMPLRIKVPKERA
jgi:amphi-Trp domain-containing protein